MRSPVTALVWEIWRSGRRMASVSGFLIAASAIAVRAIPEEYRLWHDIEPFYWLAMVISLMLTYGVFHYAEFNARRDWHGFPYRTFALPVKTWVLTGTPVFLGICIVEAVYWTWSYALAPLGRTFSPWVAIVIGAGLPCYQAIVWGLAGFRLTRIVVLSLLGIVLMNAASMPFFVLVMGWPASTLRMTFAGVPLAAIAAVIGAWYSVDAQRHGGGRGWGVLRSLIAWLSDLVPQRARPFSSPAAAQFWFEWRRNGYLLPLCVGVVITLIFIPFSYGLRHDHDSVGITFAWTMATPLILAAILGYWFAGLGFGAGGDPFPSFLMVRPLASSGIITSKLKVAALSTAVVWAIVLAFLAVWLPLWANRQDLEKVWHQLVLWLGRPGALLAPIFLAMTLIILTWSCLVGTLWPVMSGSRKLSVSMLVAICITLVIVLVKAVAWADRLDELPLQDYVTFLGWGLGAAVVLKMWLAVYFWRDASASHTWRYAVIWGAATACCVGFGLVVCPHVFWLRHLVILAALLCVPLVRVALAARALEANRHG